MKRRDLLKYTATAALAGSLPGLVAADPPAQAGTSSLAWDRILVLIELKGGNDGLNTVVPYTDTEYYKLRPNLAIAQDQVLRLTPTLGFHPMLNPLMESWEAQQLGIVMGVGYPRPNRSHFRGIDIWHGGGDADEIARDGWLARLLDGALQADKPQGLLAHAVVWGNENTVGHAGLGPLFGRELETLVMNRAEDFLKRAQAFAVPTESPLNPTHGHVLKAQTDLVNCAGRLKQVLAKAKEPAGDWTRHRFGRHMQQTAQLINGGARIPVYKLAIDGFDTHAGQLGPHQNLMDVVAKSIAALRTACIAGGTWDKVLVMTYSEFGRRVGGNDSGGTDHGTAAPLFLCGGKVKGGIYGEQPPCNRLEYGDLISTVDYRQTYASVAGDWWGYKGEFMKKQSSFKRLGLIRA